MPHWIMNIVMFAMIFIVIVWLLQIFYCCYMVIKYQQLANQERKYIYEKYGIWIEEEPMM